MSIINFLNTVYSVTLCISCSYSICIWLSNRIDYSYFTKYWNILFGTPKLESYLTVVWNSHCWFHSSKATWIWSSIQLMGGCHETTHRLHWLHRLRTGPRNGYIWVLKQEQDCFCRTFVPSVDSPSTDGTLTVNSTPSHGRKPHQRKRPAADRATMTSKHRCWLCC